MAMTQKRAVYAACFAALAATLAWGVRGKLDLDDLSNVLAGGQCTQDTGGTCRINGCYEWRKHATCSWGSCKCPENMCAVEGSCVPPEQVPAPSTEKTCAMDTGHSCALSGCPPESNSECSGPSFSFTEGFTLGRCVCITKPGTCAVDGKCVEDLTLTKAPDHLDVNKIRCPVLASLYSAGIMVPDEYGRVERLQIQKAITEGLNADAQTGWFFGLTTAGYKEADVHEQFFTMANLLEANKMLEENATEVRPGEERYLNIFRMGENPAIMHQIAMAARGGTAALDPNCMSNGSMEFPCENRFDEFVPGFADSKGRLYSKQLGDVLTNTFKNGHHGQAAKASLFTITQGFTGREYLANAGFLLAFGKPDENGDLYITVEDYRHMTMTGTFPADWQKPDTEWGTKAVLRQMGKWKNQGVGGFDVRCFGMLPILSIKTMMDAGHEVHDDEEEDVEKWALDSSASDSAPEGWEVNPDEEEGGFIRKAKAAPPANNDKKKAPPKLPPPSTDMNSTVLGNKQCKCIDPHKRCTDSWCNINCNHVGSAHCPAAFCKCEASAGPPPEPPPANNNKKKAMCVTPPGKKYIEVKKYIEGQYIGSKYNKINSVCCAASCGNCGGAKCGSREGGQAGCCVNIIMQAPVSCGDKNVVPPCVFPDEDEDES